MLKTNESAENYLETILVLSQKKPVVRGVDIAEELGFKKSSVSVAMKNLREKEQIRVTPEGSGRCSLPALRGSALFLLSFSWQR